MVTSMQCIFHVTQLQETLLSIKLYLPLNKNIRAHFNIKSGFILPKSNPILDQHLSSLPTIAFFPSLSSLVERKEALQTQNIANCKAICTQSGLKMSYLDDWRGKRSKTYPLALNEIEANRANGSRSPFSQQTVSLSFIIALKKANINPRDHVTQSTKGLMRYMFRHK